jgi:UDP-glucose 4-epimerase
MKALVLGGNGYLGQNLIWWLIKHKFEVECLDVAEHFSGNLEEANTFSYQQIDLSVKNNISRLRLEDFDLIYILVGKTGTKVGFDDYQIFVELNELLLLNLLNTYRQRKATARLIFPSSRLVFKGQKDTFLSEDSEKDPKSIYAVNKIACEFILKSWSNAFDIPFTVFRICVPYGHLLPGTYSYGTLGFMINQAKKDGVISIYGDGSQKRTFTHVADICEIFGKIPLIETSKNKIINIGSNDSFEILKLATLISDKYGAKVIHKDWPILDYLIESGDTIFNDFLLQSINPYDYQKSVEDYIKNTIN